MRNALVIASRAYRCFTTARAERVIAGFAVGPEILDGRHDQREQRRQQLLQQVADEEVLLPRLADHRGGIDRVAPVRERAHAEDRVVVPQRVVAVVIAERPLRSPFARRHFADQRELRVGDERMRTGPARRAEALARR